MKKTSKNNIGLQKCKRCNGDGKTIGYPYYATIMPKEKELPCTDCGGTGEVFVVPNNLNIIRESNY